MLYTSFRNWNVIFATTVLWTGIVAEECPSACGCFTYEYEFRIYCPENYFQVLVALGKKNDIYTDISINCISPKSDNDYCLISTILNKILIKTNIKNLTKLSFESRPQNRTDIIVSKDTFKSVPNLAALFISYNSIVTFESDFLRNIPNIIRLGLTKSGISKIHNFFSYSMMKVQYLSLRQNKINSLPDKAFENLPALMHLFLTSNNISSVSTDAFSGLRRLQMLDLSYNKIRELTEDHFKDLSKLGHINLESNRLINIDGNIFNKTPLMIVDLRNNSEIVLPDYLLANLTLLSTVDLSLNNLQEIPRNIFRKCERLSWLSLSKNRLSTLSETLFKNLYKLRTLDISENKLKALPNRLFASTPMLSKLNLSNNQLSVINEYLFSALANLYRLDLHSNKIYLIQFDAFKWQHQSLTYIDLSHNKWNPSGANNSLSYCQRLEELNLSHNKIREFPFMPALIYLKKKDLSYNLIDYFEVKYVFPSLLTPTKYDLSHNRIRNITFCLDMPIGPKLLGSTKTLLNITENPIQCDCSIYDLVRFNNGEMKDLSEVLNIIQNNLYCTGKHNNTLIQTLKPIDFECSVLPGCPSTCKCYVTPCNKRLVIDCAFKNLTIYPEIYVKEPSHQQIILNLSGNLLTEGPFEQDSYSKVTSLNLSSNRIHAMEWIPPQTKELDLSNNSLKNLNSAFIKRLKNATSLQWLGLINNPWICDCEALDLKDYLIENYNQVKLNEVYCTNVDSSLVEISDLCKEVPYLSVLLPVFLTIFLCATAVIALFYRYQTEIKVYFFAKNMCLCCVTEEEVDKDKKYDVFISYSHQDEDFVVEQLLPQLEHGENPYSVCIHIRDWIPGELISHQIINSVQNSRRTLVVLSNSFLESVWGKMEFRAAHTEALEEGRARVIVLLYGDIDENKLDVELKSYLKTNTYIRWGEKYFWNKLRYALPHLKMK